MASPKEPIMAQDHQIDTAALGLATHLNTKGPGLPRGCVQIVFDTGVVMLVPTPLFQLMILHLEERDPK